MPQLGYCASSGRAWPLWAARHSQEEAGPLGAQPPLRVLKLRFHRLCPFRFGFEAIQAPFTVLLGMLIAIRIGDAFRKWQQADNLMQKMHQSSRNAIGKMVAYLPPLTGGPEDERLTAAVMEVRRLLVLGCILIKMKIYEEKSDLQVTLPLTLIPTLTLTLTLTLTPTPTLTLSPPLTETFT